jgi:hypothetical protein
MVDPCKRYRFGRQKLRDAEAELDAATTLIAVKAAANGAPHWDQLGSFRARKLKSRPPAAPRTAEAGCPLVRASENCRLPTGAVGRLRGDLRPGSPSRRLT